MSIVMEGRSVSIRTFVGSLLASILLKEVTPELVLGDINWPIAALSPTKVFQLYLKSRGIALRAKVIGGELTPLFSNGALSNCRMGASWTLAVGVEFSLRSSFSKMRPIRTGGLCVRVWSIITAGPNLTTEKSAAELKARPSARISRRFHMIAFPGYRGLKANSISNET